MEEHQIGWIAAIIVGGIAGWLAEQCWGNRDRGCSRRRAILRRNHDPSTIGPRLVTTLLVITVAARPRLALRSDGSASGPADDRADRSPAPAAHCSA